MGANIVLKVTSFITRETAAGRELLVFRHPQAGIQLPAGTVESGETLEAAVLRETTEETGLTEVVIVSYLGSMTHPLDDRRSAERHLFHMRPTASTLDKWEQQADLGHIFSLYWSPLTHDVAAIGLVMPQALWLETALKLGL